MLDIKNIANTKIIRTMKISKTHYVVKSCEYFISPKLCLFVYYDLYGGEEITSLGHIWSIDVYRGLCTKFGLSAWSIQAMATTTYFVTAVTYSRKLFMKLVPGVNVKNLFLQY